MHRGRAHRYGRIRDKSYHIYQSFDQIMLGMLPYFGSRQRILLQKWIMQKEQILKIITLTHFQPQTEEQSWLYTKKQNYGDIKNYNRTIFIKQTSIHFLSRINL